MTRKIGDALIIENTDPKICFVCSKLENTRPYGPNGEEICFDCMISNPELEKAAEEKLYELIHGPGEKPN